MWVDFLVIFPLVALWLWAATTSRTFALLALPAIGVLGAFYQIFFIGRWGQTVGKMVAKVKVVMIDGSRATWKAAILRDLVGILCQLVTISTAMQSLIHITDSEYLALSLENKMKFFNEGAGSWHEWSEVGQYLWTFSELVVLLLNKRRRALHDFIAGTAVIHTRPSRANARSSSEASLHVPHLPDSVARNWYDQNRPIR